MSFLGPDGYLTSQTLLLFPCCAFLSASPYLQNSAGDKLPTTVTVDPKGSMIVSFAVWNAIPAGEKRSRPRSTSEEQLAPPNLYPPQGDRRAPPTYLLMYSPVRSFPQALHLKQARCQCLSRATKDWPFLISEPQFPQSVKRKSDLRKLHLPHPPGLAGDPPRPAWGQPHSWTIKSPFRCVCVPVWKIKPGRLGLHHRAVIHTVNQAQKPGISNQDPSYSHPTGEESGWHRLPPSAAPRPAHCRRPARG